MGVFKVTETKKGIIFFIHSCSVYEITKHENFITFPILTETTTENLFIIK